MKKRVWLVLGILVIIGLISSSCAAQTTPPPATTAAPVTTQTPAATKPTTGPVYGGTARVINAAGPKIMGYSLEQGPGDLFVLLCAVEKLLEYNEKQELVPHLAESFKVDDAAKTITVTMRKGIRFHDGSDCDADAIAWNYEQQVANKRIGYLDQWDRLEIKDKYTFVIYYKGSYNNQLINGWLWSPPMYSKQAFLKAGGGDIEKSKDWARLNVSGTGPFKQGEFQRDVSLTMVRNDDYWGGKPYLDAIQYLFIPDPVIASIKLQAGEADLWFSVSIKNQVELEKKGLVRLAGQPSVMMLYPNLKDPKSKWQNKDLREAIEYAIDKEGVATAMGFGLYKEAKMVVPEVSWGFDKNYAARTYNPDKAKQLLEKSGYKGTAIKILVLTGDNANTATAVKRYLDDIGLKCEVDIADPGRFFGSLYGTGWDDLLLSSFGVLGNSLQAFHMNLGDQPLTRMGGWVLPSEMVSMSQDSRNKDTEAGQKEAAGKLYKALSDGAFLVPIFQFRGANMVQPNFKSTLGQESGFTQYWGRYWLEKK
ncbi:MAG TPA: ABC transporter substrate-binding protein [Dehalococcoidales bacterium]|nr:ABC transporter substrate-binding protein [Dehalococcoidales bacterium]